MKVSGFYMAGGVNSENAKDRTVDIFNSEIKPNLDKVYNKSEFEVIDIIRTVEYDEGKGLDAYDVHFILNLPEANIEEDTSDFYQLERLVFTGLGVVDEE